MTDEKPRAGKGEGTDQTFDQGESTKPKRPAARSKAKKEEADTEKAPSHNQPLLDKYVSVLKEHLGEDCIEAAYINRLSKHVPTIEVGVEKFYEVAEFLKYNEQLAFHYLSNYHGTDFETHYELYAHLYSFLNEQSIALKVKLDHEQPVIESLTSLWNGANWPECEVYDLLGIQFHNHPQLHRIFLGEDWKGHPLRKDYEPYDEEV